MQNLCNAFDPSAFLDGVVNHCKRRANPNPKPTPDPTPTPTPNQVGHCKTSGVAFVPYSPVGM